MSAHTDLVAHAQQVFPGATTVSEQTYEAWKKAVFAYMAATHGPDGPDPQDTEWRLEALLRYAARAANHHPWGLQLLEELEELQARMRRWE